MRDRGKRMDIKELQNFLAVARSGSFTNAAATLNITQSALSRQVQRLERELGATLFDRAHRKPGLTPVGERFRKFAENTVADFEDLEKGLRAKVSSIAGELRIAASTTPGEFMLPGLLGNFTRLHPGVRPQVFIAGSGQVLSEVQNGRAEVGFVGTKTRVRGIEYTEVTQDEIVLAVPSAHPFANRKSVRPGELDGLSFLDREQGSGTMLSVRRIFSEHGAAEPSFRVAMVLSSVHAILHAVERGHGAAWVSSMALGRSWEGKVASVRVTGIPMRRWIYLIHDRRRILSRQASAFRAFVLEHRAEVGG
jgi:DNA-binding transcriptional LysR family regulator